MNRSHLSTFILVFGTTVLNPALPVQAEPLGTAITYQGQLKNAGSPASGPHAIAFQLYDALAGGSPVGPALVFDGAGGNPPPVHVTDGLFTVSLDFGEEIFKGDARWLEIVVNGVPLSPRQPVRPAPYALALPGLRTLQNAISPNVIGGLSGNTVTAGVIGATIGGGGASANTNRVTDDYGTVGGGRNNRAGDNAGTTDGRPYATVGGGNTNTASGWSSTVSGGGSNEASNVYSTVGGGTTNTASGDWSTVGGGASNEASYFYSTVGGGITNTASGNGSTVGGGQSNEASGFRSTVGGGGTNTASGNGSTVGGGQSNEASGPRSTVGGGEENTASNFYSTVGGGELNTASGDTSTVGGGYNNTAGGIFSTVPGGYFNTAGGSYSFAAGRQAKANHSGVFVWGDNTNADFTSTADNQFLIRASGGVGINTTSPSVMLALGDNGNGVHRPAANTLALHTNAAERVRVTSAGNVGIGTASPNFQLSLGSTISHTKIALYETGPTAHYGLGVVSGQFSFHLGGSGARYAFYDSPNLTSEIFTILGTGNVGIGVTSPSFQLQLSQNSAAKPTSNTWTISSDARLKKNVSTIENALDDVLSLRGVTYQWIDPSTQGDMAGTYTGLIAQEVEKVFPEWISEGADGYKRLTVIGFEGIVVEALRELRAEKDAEIESLHVENARLRESNADMHVRLERLERMMDQRFEPSGATR